VGRVLWHVTMSLDGFIAGPGDSMDWVRGRAGPSETADEVIATTGALLVGRRTYDVEDRERGGFYGGAWSGPFFVLTHRPPDTVPDWMTGTFVDEDIRAAVDRARAAAGEADVVVLGADVARQCIEQGLLDELVVHVAPVLLGEGVRLYDGGGLGRVELERTVVAPSGPVTDLRFRVVGGPQPDGRGAAVEPDAAAIARRIVGANRYLTLGTADASGVPWVSPVWYATADGREFFWVSRPEARHSRNLAARPEASIVVFDSRVTPALAQAAYFAVVAEQVADDELERGLAVYSRASQAQGLSPWTTADVRAPARHRLYRAAVSEAFVLGPRDERLPVRLD
jgi:dihydrofolate reductase/nitroimidazol reductase NimA-like FMN-containing flavoprotein (pyridoxamine 5'-phosphate oxidase superfamily)